MYGIRHIVSINENRIRIIRTITRSNRNTPTIYLPRIIERYGFRINESVEVEISKGIIIIKPRKNGRG